jgi:hypothetical protein
VQRLDDPSAATLIRWAAAAIARKILRRVRREPETVNEWRVAVRSGGDVLQSRPEGDMRGFRFVNAPSGRFYADPFPVEHEGKLWLFYEEYIYANRRAVLSCGELMPDATLRNPAVILDKPYHLSYPMVFRSHGGWYMIPESNANSTVDLYTATAFPYQWEFVKTLYHGKAVDPAVWMEDGVCWLFLTAVEPLGRGMSLLLFSSGSITADEWSPHPMNPLSTDVRNARGAGLIFRAAGGELYRPSQDCSHCYGYGFGLNRILKLNAREYIEETEVMVKPGWSPGLRGTHTYNRAGGTEAVDARQYVPASKHFRA